MSHRSSYSGESITQHSTIETNPAAWVEYSTLTRDQRHLDALARALAALEASRPAWHDRAACKGSGLDFTNTRPANVRACLQVCGAGCDVRVACLRWAIELGDLSAVLGGTDPAARRPLVREHQRQLAEQRAQLEADEHDEQDTTE